MIKRCAICEVEFSAATRAGTCSDTCRRRRATNLVMAKHIPLVNIVVCACGKPFRARNASYKYCSASCRVRADAKPRRDDQRRRYYAEHAASLEYHRAWRAAHPDAVRDAAKRFYEANKPRMHAARVEWARQNRTQQRKIHSAVAQRKRERKWLLQLEEIYNAYEQL